MAVVTESHDSLFHKTYFKINMRIFIVLLSLTIMTTGKLFAEKNRKKEKNKITKSFDFKGFDEVSLAYESNLDIEFSNKFSIEISASPEELEKVKVSLKGEKLEIYKKKKWDSFKSEPIHVRIRLPFLKELELAGANTLNIHSMKQEKFKLELAGSTEVNIEAVLKECKMELAGSSEIIISGKSKKFKVSAVGINEIHALGLKVEELDLDIAGYSKVKVNVSKKIDADIAGGGKVRYVGNPELNVNKVGFGSVKKLESE